MKVIVRPNKLAATGISPEGFIATDTSTAIKPRKNIIAPFWN